MKGRKPRRASIEAMTIDKQKAEMVSMIKHDALKFIDTVLQKRLELWVDAIHSGIAKPPEHKDSEQLCRDLEASLEDTRRLTRELDIAINGMEGAAKQASLCDILHQVKQMKKEGRII